MVIFYETQRLRYYFLAYMVHLMTKSHVIKALLRQPILPGKISQWLLQLSRFNLKVGTPKAVKSQAIANMLVQFPREEEFPLEDEVPREVTTIKITREQVMNFDGSSTANSRGAGVACYINNEETTALSFKLEFSGSNNKTK